MEMNMVNNGTTTTTTTTSPTTAAWRRRRPAVLPAVLFLVLAVSTFLNIRSNIRQGLSMSMTMITIHHEAATTIVLPSSSRRQWLFGNGPVFVSSSSSSSSTLSFWNATTNITTTNQKVGGRPLNPALTNTMKKEDPSNDSSVVVDPLALKNGVQRFLQLQQQQENGKDVYWTLLEQYYVYKNDTSPQQQDPHGDHPHHHFYYADQYLSQSSICNATPGHDLELEGGFRLLADKIRLAVAPTSVEQQHQLPQRKQRPKLLCMMYTYSPMRYLARAQALTWGRQCDGFVAFSNETIPDLGIFQWNLHDNNINNNNSSSSQPIRDEDYGNMWQKTRYMWKYAYDHFLQDYDYFYISGDDVYLMVDNFRAYLQELSEEEDTNNATTTSPPCHFGSWLPKRDMIAGGPGHTLNRAALQQWMESTSDFGWSRCYATLRDSKEDWLTSRCMKLMGIPGDATDTRDFDTGEQRFHDACPATLYQFRADPNSRAYFKRQAHAWESQPLPSNVSRVVGPKHGLDAAAKYSISFHRIHYPKYAARIHAILQTSHGILNGHISSLCPTDTPLGWGLRQHFSTQFATS